MITIESLHIYLAVRNSETRSRLEDLLTGDGLKVTVFSTATALWNAFQDKPVRFIILDRRIADGLSGFELARLIRQQFLMPYVYVLMLSKLDSVAEIKEGLAEGVDDYLIKPHNPLQLRSRVLVGIRWLNYIDSLFAGAARSKDQEDVESTKVTPKERLAS
jgi:DNA-binding response OmpR family regulator